MTRIYQSTPVILVPAATGPCTATASRSPVITRMNAPVGEWAWVPAISIPMPGPSGLPLGGLNSMRRGAVKDARLLRTGRKNPGAYFGKARVA